MNTFIAPRLTDGLCNRLFQIAAAKYYAAKSGKELCFYVPRIAASAHSDCSVVFDLFPHIPKKWSAPSFETVTEDPKDFLNFKELAIPQTSSIILQGYFQSAKYLEDQEIQLAFDKVLSQERRKQIVADLELATVWWIHIRLGDYTILPHHQCTTDRYFLDAFSHVPEGATVLLFSDSLGDATEFLKKLNIQHCTIVPVSDLNAVETLFVMSQCGGGCIGSNSTFSWWGQYLSLARKLGNPCILPRQWHKGVALEDTQVAGSWNTVL